MVRQANVNQFQSLFQTFRNQPVGFTGFSLSRRVVMRKNGCGSVIFQAGFNDLTRMNGDSVDRPQEQCVVGYQSILVIKPQDGESFAVKCGKLQTQPVTNRMAGGK